MWTALHELLNTGNYRWPHPPAALEPVFVAASHGQPMSSEATTRGLRELAARFDTVARPEHGRYVDDPRRR